MTEPIFIHVIRTGGTSIGQALRIPLTPPYTEKAHRTASETKEHIGKEKWDKGFKFSIVRNPFDRAVSIFHFCKETRFFVDKSLRFSDFVRLAYEEKTLDSFHVPSMFSPQCWWLDIPVDHIGRFETLDNDFHVVCDHLGVKSVLGHRNASRHNAFADYYDKETKRVILEEFAEDFERFGYSTHVPD